MKKCIVIPDSYKGTLSAITVCNIISETVLKHFPNCDVKTIPIADGGEGTVNCFLHSLQAKKVTVSTTNPYQEPIDAVYARLDDTAIIETASVAGLPQAKGRLNPCKTTTYGMGALIQHAVESGCQNIILGLGGSCTNDGGCGMASALGTKFYNRFNDTFVPTGDTLAEITKIDASKTNTLLKNVKITAMCDIDNPMFGPQGAAYIFSPQKGANPKTVQLLDENLIALSEIIKQDLHKDVSLQAGAGAAGALGAGVVAFLGGELKSGIDTILDLIHFEDLLPGTDMIFTGEGRIDSQSLRGKAIIGISKRANKFRVPVTVIAGSIGSDLGEEAYELGIHSIFSINREAKDFELTKGQSDINLRKTVDNIIRFYRSVKLI